MSQFLPRSLNALIVAAALLFACAATLPARGQAAAADTEPTRRALLIGINEYSEEKISDLNGAVNDVEKLGHVLTTRFGFPPDNVTTLLDHQATRANILSSLESFVAETGPDDIVYIHFSGHGSQAPDKNGDEASDQLDETLVPHDGRAPGIPDITDDELDAIFAGLKTANALVVLDSCHSGTGTRSVNVQTRSIPADRRQALYESTSTRGTPETSFNTEFDYVLMTGAAADQNALDGPIDDKFYGVFSYSLAKSLDAGPDATPADLMTAVGEEFLRIEQVWGGTRLPNPQLEGQESRMSAALYPQFGQQAEHSAPNKAFLQVQPGTDREVVLLGGNQYGAAIGSLWGLYPVDATDFGSDAIALAEVTRIRENDAIAAIDRDADFSSGARAVPVLPESVDGPITVDLRAPANLREPLIKRLGGLLGGVEFVPRNHFARFIVDVVADNVTVYGAAGVNAHDRFPWTDAESVAARLADALSRSQAAAEMTSLANASSAIDLSVKVVSENVQRGVGLVEAPRRAIYSVRGTDDPRTASNSLMLEVQSSVDAHIVIASVNAEGTVSVLFPNGYQKPEFLPDGRIPANEAVRIPDSHRNANDAGFHWDIVPPAGHDVIQVFAATDLDTARQIRHYVAELSDETQARRAPSVRSTTGEKPESVLQGQRRELGRRGIGLVPTAETETDVTETAEVERVDNVSDWTVSAVRIEVVE